MIRIKVTAVGEDFETADKLLKKTLETGVDSISDVAGSTMVEVEELNSTGSIVDEHNYSKLSKEDSSKSADKKGVKDETCKWKSHRVTNDCLNPHTKNWFYQEDMIFCNTCGKRIEVVN